MSQESLFMDGESDLALRLFREVMWKAVQYESEIPTGDEVWRSYDQMKFIAERLAQHFRTRVGLTASTPDPLLDIDLLGACRLINRYSHIQTKSILRIDQNSMADHLVDTARKNPAVLKSELEKLKAATRDDQFFFEAVTQAERYQQRMRGLK
jgi:hypothetical protein